MNRAILAAFDELGMEERPGNENNPRILEYLDATPVGRWARYDAVPWCGAFMAFTARRAGLYVPPDAHRARAWLGAGERVQAPWCGCIAVLQLKRRTRRSRARTGSARGGYHVGWFLNLSRGSPVLISGNTEDRVGVDWFPLSRWTVHAYLDPYVA